MVGETPRRFKAPACWRSRSARVVLRPHLRAQPRASEHRFMQPHVWNRTALLVGLAVLAAGGPWLVRQVRSLPSEAVGGRSDMRVVTLEVAGMTCDVCAASIRTRLSQVPGVGAADVRYREHRAYVVCARTVADSTLTAAVHRAGPGFLAAIQP